MPDLAFLNTTLWCPHCREELHDQVWFQWGYCRGRAQHPISVYAPGEAIRWRKCADGTTPAWTWFRSEKESLGSNQGSPEHRDLVVRSWPQTWLSELCPRCRSSLGGAAVEIVDGHVARGWITAPGELDAALTILRTADGWQPMPAWDDHEMEGTCIVEENGSP